MEKKIYKKFFKKRKKYLILLIGLIGIGVGVNGLIPYIFGEIIDIISSGSMEIFQGWIISYAIILIAIQILSVLETFIGQLVITSIGNDMKNQLMKRIMYMNNGAMDHYENGEILNRLEFDIELIVSYYIDLISSILMILINLIISIYFILKISVKLSFVAIIFLPLMYIVNYIFRNKVRRLENKQKLKNDQYFSYISSLLGSINPIKSFSIQSKMLKSFSELLHDKLKLEVKSTLLSSGISTARSLLMNVLDIIILTIAGMFIMAGQLTIGNMVAFNSYLEKLSQAVSKVLELNLNRQGVFISYGRIEEIENELLETDQDGSLSLRDSIQKIQFEKVNFTYGNGLILKQMNFDIIGPGLYSIVGENGCGKTTVLKLLERFYDTTAGKIVINNNSIKEYKIMMLRKKIAYMEKSPFFIKDTVYNNIRLDNKDVSEEEIEDICHRIGIHSDIMKLEQQYRTIISGNGINFSSGQKQKLGFARILLRPSLLYLLDEVTSDLDGVAEKRVCDLIEELAEKAIVINVSHKIESLKRSKKIIVMEQGRIIAQGNHSKLLKSCDLYQKLYKDTL